jgi:MerR family transcriptional regulator, copper efflux regulator
MAMRVSEIARRAGIASSALRYYESEGAIPAPQRTANGYREYTDADLCRLRVVVALRGLGLDLTESGRLAQLCSTGRCDEMSSDLRVRLTERRSEIAEARAELDHLDAELARVRDLLDSGEQVETLCIEKGVANGDALRLPVRP